jgi:hypothetical protein
MHYEPLSSRRKEASMWRESVAFCEKYGSAAASARHADCVRDLMDMRAEDKRRFAAEFDDIFF